MRLPILVLHICAGTLAIPSGFFAALFRKGSRQHAMAGNVFVGSMMTMAAAGVWLASMKFEPGNIVGGTLTLYLVATAWMTAKRRIQQTSLVDWGALCIALTLTAVELTWGIDAALSPTGLKYDYPPGPYFFLGSVALLATIGDIRVLAHGGISGGNRIARHLWRMCFGWFIASSSLFLARQKLFPVLMRKSGSLFLLSFLPLIVMIFWLVRMSFPRVRGWWGVPAFETRKPNTLTSEIAGNFH
jgi:hypothetical protein